MNGNEKTLHEIFDVYNISRRTIQGYEACGLVRATGKNKYGYLLYDEAAQKRILQLRMLQRFGLTLKDIKAYEALDESGQRERLVVQKKKLEMQIREIEDSIRQINELI